MPAAKKTPLVQAELLEKEKKHFKKRGFEAFEGSFLSQRVLLPRNIICKVMTQ